MTIDIADLFLSFLLIETVLAFIDHLACWSLYHTHSCTDWHQRPQAGVLVKGLNNAIKDGCFTSAEILSVKHVNFAEARPKRYANEDHLLLEFVTVLADFHL
jgi:hypothetical protein